jgi:hypothetical protein
MTFSTGTAASGTVGRFEFSPGGITRFNIQSTGAYFGSSTAASAKIHIAAGTATAGTGPLKLTSGVLLTTPESGLVEMDANYFYLTNGSTRRRIASIEKRSTTVSTTSSLTVAADTTDLASVTALSGAITVAAPTGTLISGQELTIRIRDNGTSRTITWDAIFAASQQMTLPAATTVGVTTVIRFMYDSSTSKFEAF